MTTMMSERMMRRKKMTKFKIAIAVVLVIQLVVFAIAGLYIQRLTAEKQDQLQLQYARRDDIVLQGQRLEAVVSELNSTVELERQRQEKLALDLATVVAQQQALREAATVAAQQKNATLNISAKNVSAPVTVVVNKPAPAKKSTPKPVTRAS
jgi:hypothetical protein